MTGAPLRETGSRADASSQQAVSTKGFDPACFEYRFSIRDNHERHDWIASGEYGAINIWAEQASKTYGKRWYGGIEAHSKTPAEYQDADKPSHDLCWLLLAPCWHDGSSLQFSEQVQERLPWPTGKAMSGDVLHDLKGLLRRRYRDWLAEPALAAGTQSAETGETPAQSEGCQSGPKGNAQGGSHDL